MGALDPGTVLHERYRIVRRIAAGGMGAVYEAQDCRLRNTVAIKQMTAVGHADAFEREARLLAALRHGGLPVVIDHFVENDEHYLVMQYIEGQDLAHVLKRRGRACGVAEVISWGAAILDVLVYLHEQRPPIVHRDIKPANVKLTPQGSVVVLDFGLAKGRLDSETHLDGARSVFGYTPHYAPPEQVEWTVTDARSDVYALGATLFHLLTGVIPPASPTRAAALRRHDPDPLLACTALNPEIPQALSGLIARALELDPARRFPSARDMRRALAAASGVESAPSCSDETTGARRVDAAMPSQATIGTKIDLLVQIRFVDSPLLGLEDWPEKRRPESLEQRSEPVRLVYTRDVTSGKLLPARLLVKLVAPDFVIDGQTEHLIEVPPDDYSKRIAFILSPRHTGLCRVNVEVYALDSLYLGAVQVEADAVAAAVSSPVYRVANLVLDLLARRIDGRRLEAIARLDAERAGRANPHREDGAGPPGVPGAPVVVELSAGGPTDTRHEHPAPRRSLVPRVPRWAYAVVPALLVTAILVPFSFRDTASAPSSAAVPPVATGSPISALPPTPTADPTSQQTVQTEPPTARTPSTASSPFEVPSSNTEVTLQISWATGSINSALRNPAVATRLQANFTFVNRGSVPVRVLVENRHASIKTARGRVYQAVEKPGASRRFSATLSPAESKHHRLEFEIPSGETGPAEIVLGNAGLDPSAARFPALTFVLPIR